MQQEMLGENHNSLGIRYAKYCGDDQVKTLIRIVRELREIEHQRPWGTQEVRTGFIAPSSRVFGRGVLVEDSWEIAKKYMSSYFLVDILDVLPLPQLRKPVFWKIRTIISSLARLSVFDVSNNRTGNLPPFNASSYLGNKDLYGYPLGPINSKGLSVVAIVGIGLGSGLLSWC
ncbi:hypothetical protein L1887_33693 [Cichorium endivia]|nr:hypothetical protein L1887_33693 [Cichorium endivia]